MAVGYDDDTKLHTEAAHSGCTTAKCGVPNPINPDAVCNQEEKQSGIQPEVGGVGILQIQVTIWSENGPHCRIFSTSAVSITTSGIEDQNEAREPRKQKARSSDIETKRVKNVFSTFEKDRKPVCKCYNEGSGRDSPNSTRPTVARLTEQKKSPKQAETYRQARNLIKSSPSFLSTPVFGMFLDRHHRWKSLAISTAWLKWHHLNGIGNRICRSSSSLDEILRQMKSENFRYEVMRSARISLNDDTLSRENFDKLEAYFDKTVQLLESVSTTENPMFRCDLPKPPLWSLRSSSLELIRKPGTFMTTAEIDTGMALCRKLLGDSNSSIDGLNGEFPYSFPRHFPVYTPSGKFVQIINVRGSHWICVSNIFSPDFNNVSVYDSDLDVRQYGHKEEYQISRLLRPSSDKIKISFTPVQKQSTYSNNCGFFAIIFAAALCLGIKPESFRVNELCLRQFVAGAFHKGDLGGLKEFIKAST